MASVSLEGVTKRFGATRAIENVSLTVADGEFFALLGPPGSGKTTLLRLVAGFETPDAGTVRLANEIVSQPGRATPPEQRRIGMVFQSYALWPHMSVAENIAFSLRVRSVSSDERKRRVAAALAMMGLEAMAKRRPHELSAGERQRVALARCLAMRPAVVLLDEPLANLDVHLHEAMQQEFARLHREIGATFVYATHDQAEAMALASRVAVMNEGRIEQMAAPQALYREPATEMVARLVGHGMVVPVEIIGREGPRMLVDLWGVRIAVRGQGEAGERRSLCLHAENLALTSLPTGVIHGRVVASAYQGASTMLTIQPDAANAPQLRVEHASAPPAVGASVAVAVRDGWIIRNGT